MTEKGFFDRGMPVRYLLRRTHRGAWPGQERSLRILPSCNSEIYRELPPKTAELHLAVAVTDVLIRVYARNSEGVISLS